MHLKDLHIGPTDNSPEIILKSEGTILIRGRGLVINRFEFFDDVSGWVSDYVKNPADNTRVILSFEYVNSYSIGFVVAILKTLKAVIKNDDSRLSVSWYLEEDDEDIMERGLHLAHVTDLPMNFIKVGDISEFNRTNPLFP
jgi:hypothetical protein